MNYRNSEMKLDQIISYFNEDKINLSPVFQRGHVWTIGIRRKLIRNIVEGRPIPAIFLYKEASGTRYSYNILDGKQRLESLILFVGGEREDLKIPEWTKYFFAKKERKDVSFRIEHIGKMTAFKDLDDNIVRDFREYAIPTIEISLGDDSSLDEVINLFVDINQQGVKVERFDIVKAMSKNDRLLRDVFDLIAIQQRRGQDIFYRVKDNVFTHVLRRLQIVSKLTDANSKVDRMWERLFEIVLFFRSKKHRKPVEILKSFIRVPQQKSQRLRAPEIKRLRTVFEFLDDAYKNSALGETRLASDQTHFYVMISSIIGSDLLSSFSQEDLTKKLVAFSEIIEDKQPTPKARNIRNAVRTYLELSGRQTTDVTRREQRQMRFIEAISAL